MFNPRIPRRRFVALLFGSLLILVVGAAIASVYLVRNIEDNLSRETEKYVRIVNKKTAALVQDRMETALKNLMSVADVIDFENVEINDVFFEFLENERAKNGFIRMSLADLDGSYRTTDHLTMNVSERPYFQQALKGFPAISDVLVSGVSGQNAIIFAVPVYRHGRLSNVLTGTHEFWSLQDFFSRGTFEEAGDTYIIDKNGNIVLSSVDSEVQLARGKLLDIILKEDSETISLYEEQMLQTIGADNEGSAMVETDGEPVYIGYCPLSFNNWYLATVYTGDISSLNSDMIKKLLIGSLLLIALLIVIVAITFLLQINNQKNLLELAYNDTVTGGHNEVWFAEQFRDQLLRSQDGSYALLAVNIEKFKVFNDEFGHETGDRLLKTVHTELSAMLQKDEYVSRTIFDLFCVLIRFSSEQELEDKLVEFVYRINNFNENIGSKYFLTFRVGGFHIYDNTIDYHVALDRALLASVKGKKFCDGLLNMGFFSDSTRRQLIAEKNLENCMEQALTDGEFEVYFQPKYSLVTNRVAGAEALIRWNSSVYGFLPPAKFVPLFERNGFIRRIDIFVFEQVCKHLRKLQDEGCETVPVSINLSRTYIDDYTVFDTYFNLVTKYQVNPDDIELELTETVAYDNMDKLTTLIDDIHRMGFSISLDDFGSGYSSLNMLRNLKVDTLKLDKEFFNAERDETIANKKKSLDIVSSVIDLARKLEMKTVAEGVESEEQVEFLRTTSCDIVQGYVFSKPLKLEEFDALLKVQSVKKK